MLERRITHVVSSLRPGGGPASYLYMLREALASEFPDERRILILPLTGVVNGMARRSLGLRIRHARRSVVYFLTRGTYSPRLCKWRDPDLNISAWHLDQIRRSQIVVSHSPPFSLAYLHWRDRPQEQRFYVFHHSPTDAGSETVDILMAERPRQVRKAGALRHELADIELDMYDKANGIILPCREAVEAYFAFDPSKRKRFEEILATKDVVELPTGTYELRLPPEHEADCREDPRIPPGKTVVGYFGRYNSHKGFDLFCDVANLAARSQDSRHFFLSAGGKAAKPAAPSQNYLDLGCLDKRTELPYYMDRCDVVMIPNRCTYFDLVLLDALSMSKPVVTTSTGGNKRLVRQTPGIILAPEVTAAALYATLCGLAKEDMAELGRRNRALFESQYTMEKVVARHRELADLLLNPRT